jgi:putative sterol carrier protein
LLVLVRDLNLTNQRETLMSLELVTNGLKEKIGEDCGLGATLKFDFGDDGVLMLDATQVPNLVSNEDGEAQCTMAISIENFMEMAEGNLDGTAAFMSGKLKIQGDMGIAMKLGPILA